MALLARCVSLAALLGRYGVLMLLLSCAAPAAAQESAAALQIKAAFVHKFATYVQGEGTAFDDPSVPLVFGIAGSEQVYDFLAELVATQNAGMRSADVRRVDVPADLAGVHVLVVGSDAAEEADALLQQGVGRSMLTITDLPGPQPANSMIHFFVADDRVRFDIALEPATAAGLRLSSRLLQVARLVGD
ncbi:MAG TPA: YfiR family protein [Pseudomonadales bacterium]